MTRSLWWRLALFACLWWILAEGSNDGWLPGSVAVLAATWASVRLGPLVPISISPTGLAIFLRFFLWNSIRGGIQVADMALRGPTALRPALIELSVNLPPGGERVLLVNTLSLMPGSVGVDLQGATLQLHVLDAGLPVVTDVQALEAAIGRLFGRAA